MTTPSASDLNLYDGTPFDQTDWDGNWNQAISWLTSGNYDMTFQNITATTYTGLPTETFNLTAGEDLTAGQIVRLSSGNAVRATNENDNGTKNIVGVATQTVTSGSTVAISNQFYDSYSGLSVGQYYYIGVDGSITATNPQYNSFIIGIAVSTTRLNLMTKPVNQRELTKRELGLTNFKIKTLSFTAILNTKYKFIDISSGGAYFTGIVFGASINTSAARDGIIAIQANNNASSNVTTTIINRNGFTIRWESDALYVQNTQNNNITIQLSYMISGTFEESQLLETPVVIP